MLAICLIDWGLQRLVPVDHKREAADGIAQLRQTDPETLVIGSSHGRTFHVLGEVLGDMTGRTAPLVAIPLENGKLLPYDWVLHHRIRPILEAGNSDERSSRKSLRRLVLLTEWWDSCPHPDGVHWNLPSRAWTLAHYLGDVLDRGANDYNRNFVQYQFRKLLGSSTLVRDRTDPLIKEAFSRLVRRQPLDPATAEHQQKLDAWQRMVERGDDCVGDEAHMQALENILDFGVSRGLETTVVLFPRMPGTLSEQAKATTLARFRGMVEERARPRGVRVIDLTWTTPLTDQDFMADFDHVSATGNLKFAEWALQNELSFLLGSPTGRPPSP